MKDENYPMNLLLMVTTPKLLKSVKMYLATENARKERCLCQDI